MSQRIRFQLERQGDPASDPGAVSYLLALFVVLLVIIAATFVDAAEPAKPEIWIYTAKVEADGSCWCGPCLRLHDDLDHHGALKQFTVHRIEVGDDCHFSVPRICYWKPNGKAGRYTNGWGPNAEREFVAQWTKDMRK